MIRRRLLHFVALLAVLLVAASSSTSCSTPLRPDYALDGPRVLAVRASPPDLVPGGSVVLDALVFVPSPTDDVKYEWSWCGAVDSNLECTQSATALGQELAPDGGVRIDYALGTGATARFAYPVDPALLQGLCNAATPNNTASDAGDAGDSGDAASDGGADASTDAGATLRCNGSSVTVTVLLKVTVNGTELRAAKSMTIYASQPAFTNTNPTIDGLELFDHAVTVPPDGGDRSDDGIADAAGVPDDASDGIAANDNGGVQLLLRVPTTASDTFTQGGRGGGSNRTGTPTTSGGTSGDSGGNPTGGGADGSATNDSGGPTGDSGAGPEGGGPGDGGGPRGDAGGSDSGGGSGDSGTGSSGGETGEGPSDSGAASGVATDGGPSAGATPSQRESLTARWYVQGGLLDATSTQLPGGNGTAARDYTGLVVNRWVPPGPGVYTVIVVLSDNRNGVGWFAQPIRVR